MASNPIDGERKPVITLLPDGENARFDGLVRRSIWERLRSKANRVILTQHDFVGAMLHDQSLNGQYPPVGHVFPVALLEGRTQFRTGAAVSSHLATIAAEQKANRAAAKLVKRLREAIL